MEHTEIREASIKMLMSKSGARLIFFYFSKQIGIKATNTIKKQEFQAMKNKK